MPAKIFVGNIASGAEDSELQGLFNQFGTVTECDIVSNYAFVVSIQITLYCHFQTSYEYL